MAAPDGGIDLRCPSGTRNLFARIVDGHIEVGCNACRRTLRAIGGDVKYVLHIWSFEGELIETRTVFADEAN